MNEKNTDLLKAFSDLSDDTLESAFEPVSAHTAHRGRAAFRIALIAAALTLLHGVGVLAERRAKGLTEQIVPVSAIEEEGEEPFTKDELVARALSTTARFDTVSVEFEIRSATQPKFSVRIDSDLVNAKAYEHIIGEDYEYERFTDGENFYDSDLMDTRFFTMSEGGVYKRENVDLEHFQSTPRTYYDEDFGDFLGLDQENVVNAGYAPYCLIPDGYVFKLLNEGDSWEITGESEYLGRKCVLARGRAYLDAQKYGNVSEFFLRIDRKTGILLTLELYNEAGEAVKTMSVSKLLIDEEETRAEIENVLEKYAPEIERAKAAAKEKREKEEAERKEKQTLETLQRDIARASQIIKHAEDEELTQEAIYNRMLNSIDYFDTASVVFQWRSKQNDFIADVTIDTDLRTHKAFQTRTDPFWGDGESYEDEISDGSVIYWYDNADKTYIRYGWASGRSKMEDESLVGRPRHWIGTEDYNYGMDVWLHRTDFTNAGLASYCLFPENFAFGYLTDFSCWEITGEFEYLGRQCIEINGTVTGWYTTKFNNRSFKMYVDEATGILLLLEGYNAQGEVENFVHVSEIAIDQYEFTCQKIIEAINSGKYDDYERID